MTMSEHVLLDSSAWLGYLLNAHSRVTALVDSEACIKFTSALSLFEVKKKMLKVGIRNRRIEDALYFIKAKSSVVPADGDLCEQAAADCIGNGLHATDAIIYRTARNNSAKLVTRDYDFRGLDGVELLL